MEIWPAEGKKDKSWKETSSLITTSECCVSYNKSFERSRSSMFLIIRSGSPEPPGVREAGMVGWDVSCLSPIFRENNHMKPNQSKSVFCNFAKWTARASGQPTAFVVALLVIVVWAFTGPIFGFSDTWQLVINTGTTIITFLMVFLIQNT
jgi:hypothetical protein